MCSPEELSEKMREPCDGEASAVRPPPITASGMEDTKASGVTVSCVENVTSTEDGVDMEFPDLCVLEESTESDLGGGRYVDEGVGNGTKRSAFTHRRKTSVELLLMDLDPLEGSGCLTPPGRSTLGSPAGPTVWGHVPKDDDVYSLSSSERDDVLCVDATEPTLVGSTLHGTTHDTSHDNGEQPSSEDHNGLTICAAEPNEQVTEVPRQSVDSPAALSDWDRPDESEEYRGGLAGPSQEPSAPLVIGGKGERAHTNEDDYEYVEDFDESSVGRRCDCVLHAHLPHCTVLHPVTCTSIRHGFYKCVLHCYSSSSVRFLRCVFL